MSSHVYVLGVSMVPLFTNLLLDLGNVLFLKVEVKAHTRSLTPPCFLSLKCVYKDKPMSGDVYVYRLYLFLRIYCCFYEMF